ncbi:MAG: hypothetical protein RLZZ175_2709 [Bacteroidota bacterium]|jgi:cyclase
MLKKRIIATLVIKNGIVVQSIGFKKYLPVGKPDIAVEFLNDWGIDEIAIIDIDATKKGLKPDYKLIEKVSKKCFVPLSVGGGIQTLDDVRALTQSGADKVIINNLCFKSPDKITEFALAFGNQCIIASVDLKREQNEIKIFDYTLNKTIDYNVIDYLKNLEHYGAGEILLNFVDRDGLYKGFDIDVINQLTNQVSIPIIVQGGAKNVNSFIDLFEKTSIEAAAAANFFHFSEHSVTFTKSILSNKLSSIRTETNFGYSDFKTDSNLRILKKDDDVLEKMLYVKIEPEII